jgi:DNA (cytosine-5)-methyltransferase 1
MLRVFECFSGYGGWSFGLKQLCVDFEVVGYSEIDKYAIQCYEQNHFMIANRTTGGQETHYYKNYGDITKINPEELPDFDLLCASPPCQAFSVAGKNQGQDDERGRLFENTIDIMRVKKPRYAIYENVKGLTFKKHKKYFEYILQLMRDCGYFVKWKILNTRDYGIPQNRERVFIICFREKEDYDKFEFPEKEELKIFVKDILEEDVDEKYYLTEKQINTFLKINKKNEERKNGFKFSPINPEGNTSKSITTRSGSRPDDNFIIKNKRIGEILSNPTNKSNLTYELTGDTPSGISRQGDRIFNLQSYPPTINCTQKEYLFTNPNELEIRKLTPKECFRLQGFLKDEINLEGISNSQCYKLAGNGLSINVVSKIFKELLK